jgi:hypothetical protein
MTRPDETEAVHSEAVHPACRATISRLQAVLDGDLSADVLEADPHAHACPPCRERIEAARLLVALLAAADEVAPPAGSTARILAAIAADRRDRRRRLSLARAGGLAAVLTAAAALAVWLGRPLDRPPLTDPTPAHADARTPPQIAPPPRPAAKPRPLRLDEELSRAGLALLETPRPWADSLAQAPALLGRITEVLTLPPPDSDPVPTRLLADWPTVTRAGLEPLSGTAQKAFARLLRDVESVSPKPKS